MRGPERLASLLRALWGPPAVLTVCILSSLPLMGSSTACPSLDLNPLTSWSLLPVRRKLSTGRALFRRLIKERNCSANSAAPQACYFMAIGDGPALAKGPFMACTSAFGWRREATLCERSPLRAGTARPVLAMAKSGILLVYNEPSRRLETELRLGSTLTLLLTCCLRIAPRRCACPCPLPWTYTLWPFPPGMLCLLGNLLALLMHCTFLPMGPSTPTPGFRLGRWCALPRRTDMSTSWDACLTFVLPGILRVSELLPVKSRPCCMPIPIAAAADGRQAHIGSDCTSAVMACSGQCGSPLELAEVVDATLGLAYLAEGKGAHVTRHKVEAHSGCAFNEMADSLVKAIVRHGVSLHSHPVMTTLFAPLRIVRRNGHGCFAKRGPMMCSSLSCLRAVRGSTLRLFASHPPFQRIWALGGLPALLLLPPCACPSSSTTASLSRVGRLCR